MSIDDFYKKYPSGNRVDTDGYPKGQPYQCVDLTKQYIHDVFGMPITAYGDAKDWWTNSKILAVFDKVTDGSKQNGDILVWGDDPGTFTGEAGHIAIWYNGKIYNQNYNGSGKISLNNFFSAGYLGALRKKGINMAKNSLDSERILNRTILGRNGLGGRVDAFTDPSTNPGIEKSGILTQEMTPEHIIEMFNSAEAQAAQKDIENTYKERDLLKTQVKELQASKSSDAETKLQAIKDALK